MSFGNQTSQSEFPTPEKLKLAEKEKVAEIRRLGVKIDEANEAVAFAEDQMAIAIPKFERDIQIKEDELDRLVADIAAKKIKFTDVQSELSQLTQDFNAAKENNSKELESCDRSITAQKARLEDLETRITRASLAVEKQEAVLLTAKTGLEALDGQLAEVTEAVSSGREQKTQLEKDIAELTLKVTSLTDSEDELNASIPLMEANKLYLTSAFASLLSQIAAAEQDKLKLTEENAALVAADEAKIKELEEREGLASKREAILESKTQTLRQYKSEMELHYNRTFKDLII